MTSAEFDYIVVGAGSAGSVLAARLSEDAAARVLLLEAGDAEPLPLMAVPPAWPALEATTANWGGESVPQAAAQGRRVSVPHGRALGGSSTINAMSFTRGHPSSYDRWATKGWTYADLLPYFRRNENLSGVADRDPAVRGMHGPLRVGPAVTRHPLSTAFLAAVAETGRPLVRDFSAGLDEGFGWADLSIADGRRSDAATAYLRPAADRSNLDIRTGTLVHRLLFTGERCTGVEYRTGGGPVVTATAVREVVVSAGAIGSPQLLMLSGIGPAADLRRHGIPVIADVPAVGTGLQDHPLSGIVYEASRTVPAAVNNHGEVQGAVRGTTGLDGPDLQILMIDVPLRREGLAGPDLDRGFTIGVSVLNPRSRGTVRLADARPGSTPLIDPAYYTAPEDLDTMVRGLRIARELGAADALKDWRSREALPGDRDLHDYARDNVRPYNHFAGTCRMGDGHDCVVDGELRVRGVTGLRIVDASVMPVLPSANTNATVYAIAERAADLMAGA
ncbi:choline dehydrogenase [Paractinoplanes deccanensis]|uniref:Choline dehydrogenase n=1 Tax=Paractinoplanes deccanensis TaxID=113561 RepID=A0ABQ3YJJ2_9ACTN|nr:GMC family oxidoreductase N-terminal domain-containing protein [Actinoplanes deccanensis]GID80165.1 choline dehydrogenase [Actinoplanes deccanensis]